MPSTIHFTVDNIETHAREYVQLNPFTLFLFLVGKMFPFRFLYKLVKENTKAAVWHVRPFISTLTAPKSTDDAL